MPVLIRYYLIAIWSPFFISTAFVLFLLNLLFFLRQFLDYVFLYQVDVENSFKLLLFIQPSFLVLTIPIGFLISLLVVYGRLSADREVVAVESCGFSPMILIWPTILLSLLMSLFMVFFMDKILPWGNVSFLKLDSKIISERMAIVVHERVFIREFEGYVLYVGEKDDKNDILKNVTVLFLNEKNNPYRIIHSTGGKIGTDPKTYHVLLDLDDGILQQMGAGRKESSNEFLQMKFRNCILDLSSHKLQSGPSDFNDSRNISIKELAARIAEKKKSKVDTRYDEIEFQKKFSLPFSALAFALIGVPLGLIIRNGAIVGPFLAVLLVALYDGFISFGQDGVNNGMLSPVIAAWLPNVVLILIGIVMVYWLNHRLDFWQHLFSLKNKNKFVSDKEHFLTMEPK